MDINLLGYFENLVNSLILKKNLSCSNNFHTCMSCSFHGDIV
jgi:hypothetical protein